MKNTNCHRCIFSQPAESEKSCEFNLIETLKNKKEIIVNDEYYYIKDYVCKYAFSKKDDYDEDQKKSIIDHILNKNLFISYYLVLYCKNTTIDSDIIKQISNCKICPGMVSFVFDSPSIGLDAIQKLDQFPDKKFKYKIHNLLIQDLEFSTILNNVVETNFNSCDQDYVFLKHINDISFLDSDMLSIQNIINIYQPPCDLIASNRYQISELFDLFLPIRYYSYIKNFFKMNFKDSILSIPNPQIEYYA